MVALGEEADVYKDLKVVEDSKTHFLASCPCRGEHEDCDRVVEVYTQSNLLDEARCYLQALSVRGSLVEEGDHEADCPLSGSATGISLAWAERLVHLHHTVAYLVSAIHRDPPLASQEEVRSSPGDLTSAASFDASSEVAFLHMPSSAAS